MIFPVRCFTCNKVLGHLWNPYKEKLQEYSIENKKITNKNIYLNLENTEKAPEGKILDELGVERYCCRMVFIGFVDLSDKIS
jgi:DNA-directed RNA polymerase subunit N (RpoN/RPB10)